MREARARRHSRTYTRTHARSRTSFNINRQTGNIAPLKGGRKEGVLTPHPNKPSATSHARTLPSLGREGENGVTRQKGCKTLTLKK